MRFSEPVINLVKAETAKDLNFTTKYRTEALIKANAMKLFFSQICCADPPPMMPCLFICSAEEMDISV